jgi:hypothetical protein
MALGHKTDGRKAGTPNRQTREISELLESLGHNPVEAMVQIATNPEASLELRGRMNAELAGTSVRSERALTLPPTGTLPSCTRLCLNRSSGTEERRQGSEQDWHNEHRIDSLAA